MVNVVPTTVSWSKGELRLVILLSVGQQTCPNTSNCASVDATPKTCLWRIPANSKQLINERIQ